MRQNKEAASFAAVEGMLIAFVGLREKMQA